MPVGQGFLYSFHYESSTDRLFKSLGLANEVQTGDSRFDSNIYVTCDHTGLREVLRSHEGVRKAVLKILEGKADPKLRCDGRFLSIEGNGAPSHSVQQLAQELGVSHWNLRDWKKRFGPPAPLRSSEALGPLWGSSPAIIQNDQ